MKVETEGGQGIPVDSRFARRVEVQQNPSVASQDVIYIPDVICLLAVLVIVVCISAMVGAEFLVGSAT